MRLSTVWQDLSFPEERLGEAVDDDRGHLQLIGDAGTMGWPPRAAAAVEWSLPQVKI